MKILIPGGGGYLGARLVPLLLGDGHDVTVVDTGLFGESYLPKDNGHLTVLKGDVRSPDGMKKVCEGQQAVICLASISRESMCQKDPVEAHKVNVDGAANVAMASKGIGQFIYASSVAVYGSTEIPATEDFVVAPTTLYGEGKREAESFVLKHQPKATIVRAASVCGYSPRQRLDLTINRMVHDAVRKRVITLEGGSQIRSHIHIDDLCDFYRMLLQMRLDLIEGQIYNVVAQNQSVRESADMVARELKDTLIHQVPRVDDRSYAVSGEKALRIADSYGKYWSPKRSLSRAVRDLKTKFDSGFWKDSETNPVYQNCLV